MVRITLIVTIWVVLLPLGMMTMPMPSRRIKNRGFGLKCLAWTIVIIFYIPWVFWVGVAWSCEKTGDFGNWLHWRLP